MINNGTPDRSRTHNLQIRNLALYPIELRALKSFNHLEVSKLHITIQDPNCNFSHLFRCFPKLGRRTAFYRLPSPFLPEEKSESPVTFDLEYPCPEGSKHAEVVSKSSGIYAALIDAMHPYFPIEWDTSCKNG